MLVRRTFAPDGIAVRTIGVGLLNSWLLSFDGVTSDAEQVDKDMMNELKQMKQAVNPTEILLVVDAMTGQAAAGIDLLRRTLHLLQLYGIVVKAFSVKRL